MQILEQIEPWGEKRADYRAARIIEAIANAAGAKIEFRDILKMFDFEHKTHDEQADDEAIEATALQSKLITHNS